MKIVEAKKSDLVKLKDSIQEVQQDVRDIFMESVEAIVASEEKTLRKGQFRVLLTAHNFTRDLCARIKKMADFSLGLALAREWVNRHFYDYFALCKIGVLMGGFAFLFIHSC